MGCQQHRRFTCKLFKLFTIQEITPFLWISNYLEARQTTIIGPGYQRQTAILQYWLFPFNTLLGFLKYHWRQNVSSTPYTDSVISSRYPKDHYYKKWCCITPAAATPLDVPEVGVGYKRKPFTHSTLVYLRLRIRREECTCVAVWHWRSGGWEGARVEIQREGKRKGGCKDS